MQTKNLSFQQALKALREGRKVRLPDWTSANRHWYANKKGEIIEVRNGAETKAVENHYQTRVAWEIIEEEEPKTFTKEDESVLLGEGTELQDENEANKQAVKPAGTAYNYDALSKLGSAMFPEKEDAGDRINAVLEALQEKPAMKEKFVKNQYDVENIVSIMSESETAIQHEITKEDLSNNPSLAEAGVKEGDNVVIPETVTTPFPDSLDENKAAGTAANNVAQEEVVEGKKKRERKLKQ
jgi:hypothetical protein